MSDKPYRIGPCWIFTASNVTDPLDQWYNLGYTRGNVLATIVDGKVITNTVDQLGNQRLAAATYKFGDSFELSFPLLDKQIDTFLKVAPGSVKLSGSSTDVFALSRGVKPLTGSAFALIPVDEYTEGDPWWNASHAIYLFNGFANVADQIEGFKQVEENDLGPYEVTVTHLHDDYGRGGIGALWLLGKDVVGFNTASEMSYRVTDTDTETALNGAGFNTMRDLVDNTGNINLSTSSLTDLSGLEYAFNSSGLDVSDNSVSQANMSDFIDALWEVRASLGLANCVIDISLNNGVDADATAKINGTGDYLYAIQAVEQTDQAFVVEGDQRGKFPAGRKFSVESSTGNDGTYTVAENLNVQYDATNHQTRIPVQEAISDTTADGSVNDGLVGAGCTVTT